ncbi:unnamed protein product [Meganyctiphanes norvegica]|uniref:Vitellogenin n=1 Tax=Meganyctiphanes norvegica TaxID=48144 RepID=A0AAV2QMC3_MEGNR
MIYGNHRECPVTNEYKYYKIESEDECTVSEIEHQGKCQTYLHPNNGNENFEFYIKPLSKGELCISIYKIYQESIHGHSNGTELTKTLFIKEFSPADINIMVQAQDQALPQHIYTRN